LRGACPFNYARRGPAPAQGVSFLRRKRTFRAEKKAILGTAGAAVKIGMVCTRFLRYVLKVVSDHWSRRKLANACLSI
jgi:hypothetical protein